MFRWLIVCILVFCTYIPVYAGEKGLVEISSEPLGAKIFVNGQRKGNTPQLVGKSLVLELEEGEYKVEAIGEGNRSASFDLYVAGGSIQPVLLVLKSPFQEPEMVKIAGGSFMMGSEEGGGREKPVHRVEVKGFWMGKYEVTFGEYDAYCEETGKSKPDDKGWGRGKRPVMNVSWNDAVAYAEWLSRKTGKQYRLPTEAEWEYAARGGTDTVYFFGNNADLLGEYAWFDGNSGNKTYPVGQKKANPFGLYDILGNVWEWTCSDYEAYGVGSETQCSENTNKSKAVRGGSWFNSSNFTRSAYRNGYSPTDKYYLIGFRFVLISP